MARPDFLVFKCGGDTEMSQLVVGVKALVTPAIPALPCPSQSKIQLFSFQAKEMVAVFSGVPNAVLGLPLRSSQACLMTFIARNTNQWFQGSAFIHNFRIIFFFGAFSIPGHLHPCPEPALGPLFLSNPAPHLKSQTAGL